jgi:hypothetical protein
LHHSFHGIFLDKDKAYAFYCPCCQDAIAVLYAFL